MLGPETLAMVAMLYGVVAACAVLLQARQILRRGSSCDVSARFFATHTGSYLVWLVYGITIDSVPLIVVDAVGLLCGLVTLAVTLAMRGPVMRPRSWTCPEGAAAAA
ncbi:MAG TPA: SemiSWEET family transporter [Solirubrobacteraceae bacterium]|nr:SemiSWEET family transporter [Solirubrobacteraceae bacterium]